MKKTLLQKIGILLSLSILLSTIMVAQTTIIGTIKDKELKEVLIGANIVIQGTSIGTSTDLDGRYKLTSDQSLPWIIEVTYTGYNPVSIVVTKDGVYNVDLEMSSLLSHGCYQILTFPRTFSLSINPLGFLFDNPDISINCPFYKYTLEVGLASNRGKFTIVNLPYQRKGFDVFAIGKMYIRTGYRPLNFAGGIYAKYRNIKNKLINSSETASNYKDQRIIVGTSISKTLLTYRRFSLGLNLGAGYVIQNKIDFEDINKALIVMEAIPTSKTDLFARLSIGCAIY